MKNKGLLIGLFCISLISVSCSKDDEQNSDNLTIKARSSYLANRSLEQKTNSNVNLTSFKINLKEIEFEMEDSSSGDGFYGDDDDIELKGPFELNLLNGTYEITSLNVPSGVYKEVEFKMAKNRTIGSDMYNKSIEIKGTINGVPFEFWHNVEEDFEIDYDDTNQNIVVSNNSTSIIFDFDLTSALNSVDLSSATDNDGDGIIEINPNDTDGNQSLANLIKDKIKDSCDLDD
ncbi:DUF4382 domain-containing protein [Flavobacterium sp.]|jgi:hypothetical protein|uniref:DUF4382 domain-containing protein n=1 Tax=Flavobacterium sp. TaxID=239 RepID=UPI0037BEA5C4